MAQNREREIATNARDRVAQDGKVFSIYHQNIQYLRNKIDRLEVFLKQEDPDIVIFTEHGLKIKEINQVRIPGYSLRSEFCRIAHRSGGVCIFTSNAKHTQTYELDFVKRFSVEMDLEVTGLRLKIDDRFEVAVLGIYRSPNGDWQKFCELLHTLLEITTARFTNVIVVGDFNTDFARQDKMTEDIRDIINMNNLEIKVHEYTRVTRTSQTIIDNILTNIEGCNVRLGSSDLSDHNYQILDVKLQGQNPSRKKTFVKEIQQYELGNINCLKQELLQENWSSVYNSCNLNYKYKQFIDTLRFHISVCCPIKKVKVKSKLNKVDEWITEDILTQRNIVREAYEEFKLVRDVPSEVKYKCLKKNYAKEVRKAKCKKTAEILTTSTNFNSAVWEVINRNRRAAQKDTVTNVPRIIDEHGNYMDDSIDICNFFNKYYQQVAYNLQKSLNTNTYNTTTLNAEPIEKVFKFHPLSRDELSRIIKNLNNKKTVGLDGVSSKILKECENELLDPLLHLLNTSLEQGIFPDDLKQGKILPIFKSGDSERVENYRPISILNVISKIFERVVLNRLLMHLEEINFICDEQHGFQKGKSTKTAIVSLVERLIDIIDSGEKAAAIFLDLSKAFDCVNHRILLEILKTVGVNGIELKWFESYLIGRNQCVELTKVDGNEIVKIKSQKLEVQAGVPQGSILGPLLFLLYVNQLPKELKDHRALLFADDTSLIFNNYLLDSLEINAFTGVQSIVQFLKQRQLTINSKKCQFLQFKSKYNSVEDREINVFVEENELDQEEKVAFLGILLDRKLTWHPYIERICNKISSGVFVLRQLARLNDKKLLLTAYHGLILSHIRYAILVWGNSSQQNMDRVFKIQKKALRCIEKVNRLDSCRPLFKKLGLLTVPSLYVYEVVMHVKTSGVIQNSDVHEYNTRNRADYHIMGHNSRLFEQKPDYIGRKFYNKLPQILKSNDDLKIFKKQIKKYLVDRAFYSVQEFLSNLN